MLSCASTRTSGHSPAIDEMPNHRNHGKHQEDMNQSAPNGHNERTERPKNQENDSDREKHDASVDVECLLQDTSALPGAISLKGVARANPGRARGHDPIDVVRGPSERAMAAPRDRSYHAQLWAHVTKRETPCRRNQGQPPEIRLVAK